MWTKSYQGYLLSAFFYGYLLTQVLGGWLATRVGGKVVIGLSGAASVLLTLVCAYGAIAFVLLAPAHSPLVSCICTSS